MKRLILALAIAASIAVPAAARDSATLLVARNDRVPDTRPSYVYAGRHQRVAVLASREECRRAGNAMVKAGYADESGATRFACLKTKADVGTIYPAANAYGYKAAK